MCFRSDEIQAANRISWCPALRHDSDQLVFSNQLAFEANKPSLCVCSEWAFSCSHTVNNGEFRGHQGGAETLNTSRCNCIPVTACFMSFCRPQRKKGNDVGSKDGSTCYYHHQLLLLNVLLRILALLSSSFIARAQILTTSFCSKTRHWCFGGDIGIQVAPGSRWTTAQVCLSCIMEENVLRAVTFLNTRKHLASRFTWQPVKSGSWHDGNSLSGRPITAKHHNTHKEV